MHLHITNQGKRTHQPSYNRYQFWLKTPILDAEQRQNYYLSSHANARLELPCRVHASAPNRKTNQTKNEQRFIRQTHTPTRAACLSIQENGWISVVILLSHGP
mmetsp:Transcript_28254/g.77565  ORF Transcript_28254/g.77565 Transcript_28254/m.77565 type:complete len:103 (+) Transcript_28254:658-966(+)